MFWKSLRKPTIIWYIAAFLLLGLTIIHHLQDFKVPPAVVHHDYFTYNLEIEEPLDSEQICRLPRIHPFDPSILGYITQPKPIKCKQRFPTFTYVDPTGILQFNETAVTAAGYSISDLHCTYKELIRRKDSDDHVDYGVPNPLPSNGIKINFDFVSVTCYNFAGIPSYAVIHSYVAPKSFRYTAPGNNKPYNVLIIGIDSMSRQSFIRNLPKTYRILTEKMKGLVFRGMTKIGDNTFPNLIALLTGKSALSDELPTVRQKDTYDNWACIWKNFSDRGYATMYAEDRPEIGLFNYMGGGFKAPPTDHYLRPYWLAVESSMIHRLSSNFCYGSVAKHQLQLKYTRDFVRQYSILSRPFFGFSFLVELSHDYMSHVAAADEDFEKWLSELHSSGELNTTFLFFLSDHGHRFDSMRATMIGRIEERMPFFALSVPLTFENEHKQKIHNLKVNRQRLTSPYDVYFTLLDILRLAVERITVPEIATSRGSSLFEPISPNRTCHMAGIPEHYCICEEEEMLDTEDSRVPKAADVLVMHINNILQSTNISKSKCSSLKLRSIQQSTLIVPNKKVLINERVYFSRLVEDAAAVGMISKLRIVVQTIPGHALFEATLIHREDSDTMTVSGDVSRINAYGSQSKCVKDPVLKKFCYCEK